MVQSLKVIILFVVLFAITSYAYYFHHDELARFYVRHGVIAIPLSALLLLSVSFLISALTGIPLFKVKKRAVVPVDTPRKIIWLQFMFGLFLGLAIFLPVVVLLIWVFTL